MLPQPFFRALRLLDPPRAILSNVNEYLIVDGAYMIMYGAYVITYGPYMDDHIWTI